MKLPSTCCIYVAVHPEQFLLVKRTFFFCCHAGAKFAGQSVPSKDELAHIMMALRENLAVRVGQITSLRMNPTK